MYKELDRLFRPGNVAVIGASSREGSLGRGLAENILRSFPGNVYLVNKRGGEILGRRAYKSIEEIGEKIDLALIIVPASSVPEVLEDLARVGGRFAVVYSGGFRESGREDLEKEILEIAGRGGVRILGPNCVGFIDNWTPINATFVSIERQGVPKRGFISLISQSGALGSLFLDLMSYRGLGLSKFISVGNASDIKISELLRYLSEDQETKVVGLYIESVGEGRELIESLRYASQRKPVVILKGGRTSGGFRAALSHVGALTTSPELVQGVLRSTGAHVERDLRGFIASLEALEKLPRRIGSESIVIVTNTGGLGVLTVDALEEEGFKLLELSEKHIEMLRNVIPAYMSVNNPIDLSGDSPTSRYREVIDLVMKEISPDLLIIINQPQTYAMDTENFIKFSSDLPSYGKPFIILISGGLFARDFAVKLREKGMVVAEDPQEVISMLKALRTRPSMGEKLYELAKILSKREEVLEIFKKVYKDERRRLYEYEAKEVFKIYGIDIPRGFIARGKEDLEIADLELRYPLVMKIISRDIIHKSDIGGVVLGIRDLDELKKNYDLMVESMRRRGVRIEGVLVEEMVKPSIELIIGGFRDPLLGPVIMFGYGGLYVELFRDISFRPYDATKEDILSMIDETKISIAIKKGLRGLEKIDPEKILGVLASISRIFYENPEVREAEINPATIADGRIIALDARIVLD
ncbi:MAG: acetate--CoA ligase family protein [Sulfolobales archaeon]